MLSRVARPIPAARALARTGPIACEPEPFSSVLPRQPLQLHGMPADLARYMSAYAGVAANGPGTTRSFARSVASGGTSEALTPVGAITSKKYAFKGRYWEVDKVDTIDVIDAFGSSICVYVHEDAVVRIIPNLSLVQGHAWLSDRSRFFFDQVQVFRVTQVMTHLYTLALPVHLLYRDILAFWRNVHNTV